MALAIAAGTVLRVAALPLSGSADLPIWKTWSYNAAVAGTSRLYGTGARAGDRLQDHVLRYEAYEAIVDYPPLVLNELAPVGWLFAWLTDGRFRDSVLFTALIKAEPVVFEAAFTALLFAALRRTAGPPAARWAVMAYWLNPAAWLSASVGGYLDALFVLPAAGSLVAATGGWPVVAGGLITASALTKPQGLFVVPAVLIGLWNAGDPAQRSRRLVRAAVGAAAVSVLVVGPVVVAGAWWNMVYALRSQAAEVEITMEGYNFWWIAGHFLWTAYGWQRGLRAWSVFTGPVARVSFVSAAAHGLPHLRVIGTVMAAAGILWGAWMGRRARELWHVAAVGAFSVHAFTVLGAQVHQNHLFAAMPLLVIACAERRRFVPILVGVTVFISLSLLFVLPVHPDGPFVLSRTWTFLDTTLLLAIFNCILFIWHAKILREESSIRGWNTHHHEETAIETSEVWLCRVLASGLSSDASLTIPGGVDAIMEVARGHRVDVLLADLLLRAPDGNRLAPISRQQLEDCVRQAVAREMSAFRDLSLLLEVAQRSGLDLLLLKGAALAYTHYSRPYLRPRNDVDLYVRRSDLDRAEAMLASRGYERAPEANAELWTGQRHYAKTTPAGTSHVDLHWRVVNPRAFAGVLAFDDVWPRSVSVPPFGPRARTLSPPDTLLLACVHRVAHHQDRVNLLWLWDIHLVASALSADEWSRFVTTAASARVRSICARGLALSHDCFGTAIPEDVRLTLVAARDEPAASFLGEGLRTVDVARIDLAALTSWRSKLALIREHVCPPIAYMRTKYARCPPILLPLAYLHRIVRGAPRWFER